MSTNKGNRFDIVVVGGGAAAFAAATICPTHAGSEVKAGGKGWRG